VRTGYDHWPDKCHDVTSFFIGRARLKLNRINQTQNFYDLEDSRQEYK